MSLEWLLEDIFRNLDRGFLLETQTRQQLVDYFDTIIEQFRLKNAGSDGQAECDLVSSFCKW